MPRKSSKKRGTPGARAPAPKLHAKAAPAAPNPNPVPERPRAVEVPDAGAGAAAEALERLDVSAAAEDAPVEPAPPEPVVPATPRTPSQPPLEASSSGRAAVGGRREEEAVRRLQELVGVGGESVQLTEEEVRANDQRQEDEVMLCSLSVFD